MIASKHRFTLKRRFAKSFDENSAFNRLSLKLQTTTNTISQTLVLFRKRKKNRHSSRKPELHEMYPDATQDELGILRAVQDHTMTSPERILALCQAVEYVVDSEVKGDFVECGVWRGGSMAAVARTLVRRGQTDRTLWLYDTFEGMSPPGNVDVDLHGLTAESLLQEQDPEDPKSVWCRSSLEHVRQVLIETGYAIDAVHFVPGKVEDTLPQTKPEKIALLRLDTDWYESTRCELEELFPRLSPGAVLIVDDYGHCRVVAARLMNILRNTTYRCYLVESTTPDESEFTILKTDGRRCAMSRSLEAPKTTKLKSHQQRLNIGCGRQYHHDWINLDLETDDPNVLRHNVIHGLPFAENHFDVIYHSHILEHLKPENGANLMDECYRVLRPGGVLRIVVPDLERIASLYLEMHDQAWQGDDQSKVDYNWIKLELLDQLVREYSGGRMGRYMANPEIQNSDFVRSRVGEEFWICRSPEVLEQGQQNTKLGWSQRIQAWFIGLRERLARRSVRLLMGRAAEEALDEGLFRSRGEIHRWMYDRLSLRELCEKAGFVDFRVMAGHQSQIENFQAYQLDVVEQVVRKPDSLFVECVKPDQIALPNAA